MVGLLPDVSLAALDMTIVARAIQATADDLGVVELQARTGRPTAPGGDLTRSHPAQPTARCAPTSSTTRAWARGSRVGRARRPG
jgi:hypothetical protein